MKKNMARGNHFRMLVFMITAAGFFCSGTAFSMGMGFGDDAEPAVALQVTRGPLSSPVGIEPVYSHQRLSYLLVTDAVKETVNIIDPQRPDRIKKLFKVDGVPLGVAKYKNLIYVGNRSEGSVDIYSSRGDKSRLLRRIKTDAPMQANGVAIDPWSRQLFVADGLANDVKIFTLFGRLVRTIDGFGDLFDPRGVAIHPRSRSIAITDSGDKQTGIPASIQIYDYSGTPLLHKVGAFSAPGGVALSANRLFVADALLGQVLVFNRSDGVLLGTFGNFGTEPGQLFFPLDLAFDEKRETLYVVNNRMGRIESYSREDFKPVEVPQ